jgi:hypothetical protein
MNLEQRKEYDERYRLKNKDKIKQHKIQWYYRNKDKVKVSNLKNKYNLTLDQYNKMLSDQNNSCKVCNTHESKLTRKLSVDHCHTTGKVRGMLCSACNTSLGQLKEDTKIMQKLIEYVKEHNE